MLKLGRITRFNEFLKCSASGEILMIGDFYLEDEETGKIISYKYYRSKLDEKRRDNWPGTKILENFQSQKDYQDAMREKEQEYLSSIMLDQKIVGSNHESDNYEKDELNG